MTEKTLGKAIEIKRKIDALRERKEEIKRVRKWCEVKKWCKERNIIFRIQMQEGGCNRDSTKISEVTAKLVLDKEIEDVEKEIEVLINELSDMN